MKKKVVWLPYDFDTAIGINNEGALVFSYNLEDTDKIEGGADVYNGQQSVVWTNLRDAFPNELREMYQNLRSTGALSYSKVEDMFESHQSKWPEAIFNEDSWFKYILPLTEEGKGAYLSMLQGSKAEQRKWWLYNRFRYLDSKYNAGDSLSDVIQLRGYAKSNITIIPYADIYPTVKFGSYLVQKRGQRNVATTLVCPLDNVNDTEIYVYSASQLASVGDLSGLLVGFADFSMATKIQDLKIGDSSIGYSDENLKSLTLGNNVLLKTIDVRNCTGLGTGDQKTVDLSGCSNIEEVYFDGTNINGVSLPNGGVLRKLHLPATITNFTLLNQGSITELVVPSYQNITTLRLENVSNVVDERSILESINDGTRVRMIGFSWECEDLDEIKAIYANLDKMRGLDEQGNNVDTAQVSGRIHTYSLKGSEIAELNERYPYINVVADHTTSYAYYYNYDGTQLLQTVEVLDGGDSSYSGTPARTSTAQYDFTFVGWSTSKDAQSGDSNAEKHIVADRKLYAAYSRTVRNYTVRFMNGTTVLETYTVPYGGSATYKGSDPVYPGGEEGFEFSGFNPDGKNITGNTDCVAVYIDTNTPLVQYLRGTITDYSSETVNKITSYAFYGRTKLKNVKTSATQIDSRAFQKCSGLTTVDLTATSPITISDYAFNECSSLSHLIIRSNTVCTANSDPFVDSSVRGGTCAIYVPTELVDSYKADTYWSRYAAQIFPISAYPVTDLSTISDSWADIVTNANYATDYKVGDTKLLDLGSKGQVYMELVAMDTDVKADGSGNARMTWLSKSIIEKRDMNVSSKTSGSDTGFTAGGWENTDMRAYLKSTIKPLIPEVVRNAVVEVTKISSAYTGGALVKDGQTTTDDVWIPSAHEIFNNTYYETTGAVYSAKFNSDANRIKYNASGSAYGWWLRSAHSTSNFRYVNSSGYEANNGASVVFGIVLGFCI